MTYEEIRLAFIDRMMTFQGIEQSRIEYPNQEEQFDIPANGLWCRMHINYATAFMAGMADVPYTRKPGVMTVQCFTRLRSGVKELVGLADDLEAWFAYWSTGDLDCWEVSIVDVGQQGAVGGSQSSAAFGGAGFYQINVNIRFSAG